mmetsp:Transcript_24201/g.29349  ORF Transcript_24201/g.29349 Transcript_24201/m.29349 type:complete len:278 (-) Transcript_24201:259-1092(-)|eukprot:CAMPEP_0197854382 /NCGR_PEP_ID=MMETSP1438-20131217/24572_1 /TAXON_ID=1461541 /ORGANISM="Pterosperma sp., Strain CCMP1384" /LENGTH=277 /DNA_ID=CAMNT_0043469093 /DNA_START=179 /DNA_END=1012 /DNA_ORIENTATION=+
MALKKVLVTGGNSGIGLALCKQLVQEDGCHVFMGSRNVERGTAAIKSIVDAAPECAGKIDLVQIDTCDDDSVKKAATLVKEKLASESLYAIVNNAGAGLQHGETNDVIVNTNFYGPKRVCEAFLSLLDQSQGRIVNVGSGAGPSWVSKQPLEDQKQLCSPDLALDAMEGVIKRQLAIPCEGMAAYGVSKHGLTVYTQVLAKAHPNLKINCLSPGFINTKMTVGWGASKEPEEGTVAIRHCLFQALQGNGWYYGSDAVRSPLHYMRNPGEPAYDGSPV